MKGADYNETSADDLGQFAYLWGMNDQQGEKFSSLKPPEGADIKLALSLLMVGQPPESIEPWLQQLDEQGLLPGLWIAHAHGALLGAAWGQLLGGGGANLWPPRLVESTDERLADRLIAAVLDDLLRRGTEQVQLVLPHDDTRDSARLPAHGFQRLSDLLYLAWFAQEHDRLASSATLRFTPLSEVDDAQLAEVVERTYQGTLDLPQLNGQRSVEAVLEEYRTTAPYDPALWFLVSDASQAVGCLLLADQAEHDYIELVYMGIVPEARGRRWGEQIVGFAQRQTRLRQRSRLALAVAADNHPATNMYNAGGFVAWERRQVWWQRLRVAGE